MNKKVWTYDLETLPNFFCAVFKLKDEQDIRIFEISSYRDDYDALMAFLKTEVMALRGFNNIEFDAQVIEYIWNKKRSVEEIYSFVETLIDSDKKPYNSNKFHIFNLDIYKILHLDNKNRRVGLKWCQFMIDWHNIEDMPFHKAIENREEAELIIQYCINDVLSTEELFNKNKKEISLRVDISNKYNLNFYNASNSKIGSDLILDLYCKQVNLNKYDVRNMKTPRDVIRFSEIIFPYIEFKSTEFNMLLSQLKKESVKKGDKFVKSVKYKGFQFDYGLGGIHGSLTETIIKSDDEYIIIDADVASLYPSIAVVNNLYPEHLGVAFSKIYNKDIVSVRLAEKAKPDGDKAIIAGLKEAANSVYGKSNEEVSWLYDPKYTYTTTINGQLMLTMLAEDLMNIPNSQLIQINTDGLTIKIKKEDEQLYYDICKNWEKITNLQLEYAYYDKMMIRDVNNYIAVYTNGKTKCKGAFEIENIPLHKNKSSLIVRKAIYNYFIYNVPIEETIRNCDNILDFCLGVRMRNGAKLFIYNNKGDRKLLSKTLRYFISNRGGVIRKEYINGDSEYLNAPTMKGRAWYQTTLNTFTTTSINENKYDVNYNYYIIQAKDMLFPFLPKTTIF